MLEALQLPNRAHEDTPPLTNCSELHFESRLLRGRTPFSTGTSSLHGSQKQSLSPVRPLPPVNSSTSSCEEVMLPISSKTIFNSANTSTRCSDDATKARNLRITTNSPQRQLHRFTAPKWPGPSSNATHAHFLPPKTWL